MTAIDARELKLRIVGSFSTVELRRLLDSVGATHADLPDDKTVLASQLLKVGASALGMGELIRRLKAEKPLYEWPDVDESDARWATPAAEPNARPPEDSGPSSASVPDLLEAALVGEADAAPVSLRAGRAPVAATVAEPPAAAPAPASRRSASDAPPVSAARPNPMVFRPPEPDVANGKSRGIDPKLLVAALGLTVLLAAIAFGAGLLWRRGGSETAAASSTANAPQPRSSGLAGHAADELEARIVNVAALCDLGLDEGASKSVFESAQRGCGTVEQERLRRKQRAALDAERPAHRMPDPPPEATEDDPTPVRTPKSTSGAPPANRCMTACQRTRSDCESSCGPEPKDASGYDKWQACSGRCLTDDARCRVACN